MACGTAPLSGRLRPPVAGLMCLLGLAPAGAVVGGRPAPEAAASAVMVLSSNGGVCTGIVVAPDAVLTAGHCVAARAEHRVHYTDAAGAPVIKEGPDGVVFYTLPDIVVNMQSADGRSTLLKLKLTFELPDEETAEALTPNLPRLSDMFQTFLRELRPEDLNGSQGSFQLRAELLRRVNLVAAPSKVNAVLIEEMLIN